MMHPDDAAVRGITDGMPVRVFNDRGEFTVFAKLDEAVQHGVVVSSLGGWRKHSKATATLAAVNSTRFADLGNAPTFPDTLVEVDISPDRGLIGDGMAVSHHGRAVIRPRERCPPMVKVMSSRRCRSDQQPCSRCSRMDSVTDTGLAEQLV